MFKNFLITSLVMTSCVATETFAPVQQQAEEMDTTPLRLERQLEQRIAEEKHLLNAMIVDNEEVANQLFQSRNAINELSKLITRVRKLCDVTQKKLVKLDGIEEKIEIWRLLFSERAEELLVLATNLGEIASSVRKKGDIISERFCPIEEDEAFCNIEKALIEMENVSVGFQDAFIVLQGLYQQINDLGAVVDRLQRLKNRTDEEIAHLHTKREDLLVAINVLSEKAVLIEEDYRDFAVIEKESALFIEKFGDAFVSNPVCHEAMIRKLELRSCYQEKKEQVDRCQNQVEQFALELAKYKKQILNIQELFEGIWDDLIEEEGICYRFNCFFAHVQLVMEDLLSLTEMVQEDRFIAQQIVFEIKKNVRCLGNIKEEPQYIDPYLDDGGCPIAEGGWPKE